MNILVIMERRSLFDKLNGMVKHFKEHDSSLFQPGGSTLLFKRFTLESIIKNNRIRSSLQQVKPLKPFHSFI